MAKLHKTPMLGRDKLNQKVIGVPESQYDPTFDSTFERSVDSDKNCVLKISLRIFYKQINPWQVTSPVMRQIAIALGLPVPAGADVGSYGDADEKPHLIKSWTGREWATFTKSVKAQAMMWNNKFWLIPPDDFSLFDIVEGSWTAKSGSITTRPNVKCEFQFEIAPTHYGVHSIVEVVNLLGPGFFRSHSRLYSNDDTKTEHYSKQDWQSKNINTTQPTITHEIGHSLGLPHIGVSRSLTQCTLAVVWGANFHQKSIPAIYKGWTNADVCYGTRSSSGDINNIMGAGSQFSKENAKPWLDRLPHHLNLSTPEYTKFLMGLSKWKVSMKAVAPMGIVKL